MSVCRTEFFSRNYYNFRVQQGVYGVHVLGYVSGNLLWLDAIPSDGQALVSFKIYFKIPWCNQDKQDVYLTLMLGLAGMGKTADLYMTL
jgi:hypothetical protein